MVQIKFTTLGANSAIGAFGPGDLMRCSEALARHLVEEVKCAVYVTAQAKDETDEHPRRNRRRGGA